MKIKNGEHSKRDKKLKRRAMRLHGRSIKSTLLRVIAKKAK